MTTDTHDDPAPLRPPGVLLLLVLLSGAAGLMLEVVFTRRLVQILGSTSDAVATVLAAFMAGFALGAFFWGFRADRVKRPVLLYAVLEVAIGLSGLAVFLLLPRLEPLFAAIYALSGASSPWFSVVRFAVLFGLLLVPTTGMGATLPVLARAVALGAPEHPGGPSDATARLGRAVGLLYAVNTAGAVLGTLLAGFVLVELLGLTRTVFVAAVCNFAAAVGVLFLVRGGSAPERSAGEAPAPAAPERPAALAATFVSGFAALGFEVVWTRLLIFYITGTTYAFSTMLATFLVGIALGSYLWSRRVDADRRPRATLSATQALAALLALFVVEILFLFPQGRLYPRPYPGPTWLDITLRHFLEAFAVMLLPTLCIGGTFPVACRLAAGSAGRVGRDIGAVYVANTLGAILGSIVAGFVLIPWLGLHGTSNALAFLLMASALVIGWPSTSGRFRASLCLAAGAFGVVLFLLGKHTMVLDLEPDEKVVFYDEGRSATVAVVERAGWERRLLIDNIFVAGSHPVMLTDQKSLAHFPCLLHPAPRRVLSVGFGSGGASHSFSLYEEVERVECVEILPEVLRAAPLFEAVNHGIRENPKFSVILDDARSYLTLAPRDVTYDVIVSDCTDLSYRANADLYQREFFAACRARLNPGGIMCVWLPLRHLSPADFRTALASFRASYPDGTLWYMLNFPCHYVLLMGSDRPLSVDLGRFAERMARPAIRDDLAEIGFYDPRRLASCMLLDPGGMSRFTEGARWHTEDRPLLEFTVPRYDRGMEREFENLEEMMPFRVPLSRILPPGGARDALAAERDDIVAGLLIEGHVATLRFQEVRACRAYALALKADPTAVDLRGILAQRRRRYERYAGQAATEPQYVLDRANLAFLDGRFEDAARDYGAVASAGGPNAAEGHLGAGVCERLQGRGDGAVHLEAAEGAGGPAAVGRVAQLWRRTVTAPRTPEAAH